MKTLASVIEKIKRYRTRTEFMANCKMDYAWLRANGLEHVLDELRPRLNSQKDEITLSYILDRAKRCASQSQFQQNYYKLYQWAKERGLLAEIEKVLPTVSHVERARRAALNKAFTDEELTVDAKNYSTLAAWREAGVAERQAGGYSHYGAAIHRGRAFMQQCCAHMLSGRLGNKHRLKYSDDDLIASAKPHQHKIEWKEADRLRYNMAILRPEVFARATAHMTPKAHPYSGSYIVYAYEFADHHVYVGHTFRPSSRRSQHMQRGPVLVHMAVRSDYVYKVLEDGLNSPVESAKAEARWQAKYQAEGWVPLWTAKAGGLGTIQVQKWTKEAVFAEAKKYKTRQEWIDNSQMSYRIAKREGWFDAASAHMPRRVLGIGVGREVSAETREKQRQAKLGVKQPKAQRDARAATVRAWWAARKAQPKVAEAKRVVGGLLS